MQTSNKYSKNEKLKSKKAIEHLFKKGKSINAFPIRVIHVSKQGLENISINAGVTVSKKNIKLAVNRNLIKRRIREAYRLNNHELKTHLKNTDSEMNIMFIYSSKEILPYALIESKIKVLLTRLIEVSEVVSE
jgi:ribonuclease P protein component